MFRDFVLAQAVGHRRVCSVNLSSNTLKAASRVSAVNTHAYLHDLCDRLHDTPMQRKLRRLAPMPIGCVFIQWPEMSESDIRHHFRTMKSLGFTNLKQIMNCPDTPLERIETLALEEGLIPWWYDVGGWEDITPERLAKLGLPKDIDIELAMKHPVMIEHQAGVLQRRIVKRTEERRRGILRAKSFLPAEADENAVPGVVHSPEGARLDPQSVPFFAEWLKKNFGTLGGLKRPWNCHSSSLTEGPDSHWQTWEEAARATTGGPQREFRRLRDVLRFKANVKLDRLRQAVRATLAADPDEPLRAGGEISIFLPHTAWAIDMEGMAHAMADGGAFYPSMHPGWHLEEVDYELVRPTYMQASACADWARGIWSGPFESSGGPQWWSGGGKVPFVPEVKPLQPAFAFTAGTMSQLLYTYLAAGFKGFGLWCWNPREAGWEAGEYALCDRNNEPTPRAVRVGQIGQAMQRLRRELWQAHKEPWVGVFQDWENDAMWAALATPGRDRYKMEPIKARIGAARALINANVPWEYVTRRQLEAGLAPRYRSIYLTGVIGLSAGTIEILADYVKAGGRVVLDMPGAWLDEYGRLLDSHPGSAFERLFGAVLHEYGYANNIKPKVAGIPVAGFSAVLTPTTARAVASYSTGGAAITENRLGNGAAVILGADASLASCRAGNAAMERLLVKTALGGHKPPFLCKSAIVYRLAAPTADHYFLLNEGPARKVKLDVRSLRYRAVADPVNGEGVSLDAIGIEADGGRWIRCEK